MVDSSPRPIAASHVLHRLLVPRHPPFALGNLTTKMLASTVQFSNNGQPRPPTNKGRLDQKKQTPQRAPVPSGPNRMLEPDTNHTTTRSTPSKNRKAVREPPRGTSAQHHQRLRHMSTPPAPTAGTGSSPTTNDGQVLLRKEVIQPHLPVRLPCYDFVPIANPTFDGSLPKKGLGHRLRVLPTFVT